METAADRTPPTAPRRSRLLILLALLNASTSSSLYLAILPALSRELALSESQAGLLVTASALAFAVAAPWWGRRSERWGRTSVLVAGLAGYACASVAFAVVGGLGLAGTVSGTALFGLLLLSRPLGGALAAAVPSAAQAYIADTTSAADRTGGVAVIGIANGLGMVLGPAVGGALAAIGLLAPMWVAAAAALATAVALRLLLREPPRRAAREQAAPLRLTDPRPRPLLVCLLALFATIAVVSGTLGFLLQDRLGLDARATASTTGLCLVAVGLALIATQVAYVQRTKPAAGTLLRLGVPVMAAGVALLLVATAVPVFVAACLLMGSGAAMASSGAIAGATLTVQAHEQGALGGLTTTAQTLGFVVGPMLGGVLYETGRLLPATAGLVLLALIAAWAWARRWPAPAPRAA